MTTHTCSTIFLESSRLRTMFDQHTFGYVHFYNRADDSWLGCLNPMTVDRAWEEADRINSNVAERSYAKVRADNDPDSEEISRPDR